MFSKRVSNTCECLWVGWKTKTVGQKGSSRGPAIALRADALSESPEDYIDLAPLPDSSDLTLTAVLVVTFFSKESTTVSESSTTPSSSSSLLSALTLTVLVTVFAVLRVVVLEPVGGFGLDEDFEVEDQIR